MALPVALLVLGRRKGAELAAGRNDIHALGEAGPSLAVDFDVQAGLLVQGLRTAHLHSQAGLRS
jgi:hypothetical protein